MRNFLLGVAFAAVLVSAAYAQAPFLLRIQQGDNLVSVANGSSVAISSPSTGTSRTVQVLITYTGGTSATFPNGVTLLGSTAFSAQLTSGGTTLAPYQTATVELVFTPSGTDAVQAELDIAYVETALPGAQAGRGMLTLGLSGGVPVYALNYTVGTGGNVTTATDGGQILFPDTVVNSTTTAAVSLVNQGIGAGRVTSVALSGSAFSLASLPALPAVLNFSASLPFQIVYLPRQAGNDTGTVTIGFDGGVSQHYQLQGRSILSQLSYSMIQTGSGSTPLLPNQTVQFPQTPIGGTSPIQIQLTNTSHADFALTAVTSTGAPFGLTVLPALPATLAPGASTTVTVAFSPTQLAPSTGSLRIGADTFALSGTAFGLPDYTISGPAQVGPLEQPSLSLTLNQPYPVETTGTLTVGVASDYGPDPAVQFSTGGRTVSFTIAANSTQAVFPNGTNTIRLQTGSVASTFTVTPAFATQGGTDLTPASPATLQFAMPTSAPSLLGIQVAATSNTALTLQFPGVTTVRSLTKLSLRFTAAAGFNVPNLNFDVDLTGPSSVWFNSTTSQAFGGQFTLSVPFILSTSDTSTTATPPVQALQSVTATLTSSTGDSNTVSLNLR